MTVQLGESPVQAPVHPANMPVASAVAVTVATAPAAPEAVQLSVVQATGVPLSVMLSVPGPILSAVSEPFPPGFGRKLAATELSALRAKLQVGEVPEQAPDQPEKLELLPAAAVSVTTVPSGWTVLQGCCRAGQCR